MRSNIISHRPRVIFVVAYERSGIIGRDGALPWHLPADLLHFKALTIGKPVIMGRKTFASIGKPLKLRRNIVLTRDPSFDAPGIETAAGVQGVFDLIRSGGEIAVIGGAEVFAAFEPFVDSVYATEIDADIAGDARFTLPARQHASLEIGRQEPDERHAYAMRFVRYDYTEHPDRKTGGSANESNPSA